MKILAITINYIRQQEALIRSLKSIATEFHYLDWMEYEKKHGRTQLKAEIQRLSNEIKPDLTFIQVQTAGIITPQMDLKGFVVNWTGDARQPLPNWFYQTAKAVNVSCFSNETDVEVFRKQGLNSEYLQIGFDDHIFKPDGAVRQVPDIVFMGNNYNDTFTLGDYRKKMVRMLKDEFGGKFGLYGSGWSGARDIMYKYELEAEVYRSCKIGINLSHYDLERYTSDRMYRLMGSGALCMTKAYPGINKDFTHGENVVIWYDLDDLNTKLWYYLENPEEASAIAMAGCKLVHEKHRWENRMEDLIKIKKKYDKSS